MHVAVTKCPFFGWLFVHRRSMEVVKRLATMSWRAGPPCTSMARITRHQNRPLLHHLNWSFTWQLMCILDALIAITFKDSSCHCWNLWQRATFSLGGSLSTGGMQVCQDLARWYLVMFKHVQTLLPTRIKVESDTAIWYRYEPGLLWSQVHYLQHCTCHR